RLVLLPPFLAFDGQRRSISSSAGEARKIEENVPTTTPTSMIVAKPRMISPPNKNSASSAVAVVIDVMTVRGSVSLMDRFSTSAKSSRRPVRLRFSRARSNTTGSEEHTSELQSRENLVCRLLLEKKK